MASIFGKLGLQGLFLLSLGLNGSYCFKLFWWGAEPEKVSTEPQYGECDWAKPTTTAQLQAAAAGANNGYGYNNAGYNSPANAGYNGGANTGYNAAGNGYVNYGYNSAGSGYIPQNTGYSGGRSSNEGRAIPDSQIPISAGGNSVLFYHEDDLVASHPTLPIGSYANVTNSNNEKFVVVRIIEQRPCVVGRILTLSSAAFKQIADLDQSVFPCYVSTT